MAIEGWLDWGHSEQVLLPGIPAEWARLTNKGVSKLDPEAFRLALEAARARQEASGLELLLEKPPWRQARPFPSLELFFGACGLIALWLAARQVVGFVLRHRVRSAPKRAWWLLRADALRGRLLLYARLRAGFDRELVGQPALPLGPGSRLAFDARGEFDYSLSRLVLRERWALSSRHGPVVFEAGMRVLIRQAGSLMGGTCTVCHRVFDGTSTLAPVDEGCYAHRSCAYGAVTSETALAPLVARALPMAKQLGLELEGRVKRERLVTHRDLFIALLRAEVEVTEYDRLMIGMALAKEKAVLLAKGYGRATLLGTLMHELAHLHVTPLKGKGSLFDLPPVEEGFCELVVAKALALAEAKS